MSSLSLIELLKCNNLYKRPLLISSRLQIPVDALPTRKPLLVLDVVLRPFFDEVFSGFDVAEGEEEVPSNYRSQAKSVSIQVHDAGIILCVTI